MSSTPQPRMRVALLQWHARQWVCALGAVALLPAMTIWGAATVQTLGLAPLLDDLDKLNLPEPAGLGLSVAAPALAAALAFLSQVDMELRLSPNEVRRRIRLASASRWTRLVAASVLLVGLGLFALMSGHLAADCLLGGDCPRL